MFGALSRGVRNGQIEIDNDDLGSLGVLLPPVEEQRRIAAFLDDQTTRIDRIMTARLHQRLLIPDWATGEYAEIVFAGDPPSVRLGSIADVRLGRQRSPANASGDFMCRYLRSANVLDGRVVLDDVNEMNFEPKERLVFSLRPGDLLVTEGAGSPEAVGASAMWDGREPGICFQNTLLRVRSRSEGYLPEYLGWWARTAHRSGAMRAYSSGASILHLGAEGLSRMEVPRRSRREQSAVIANCDRVESEEARTLGLLSQSVHLLQEFKRSLISAAVSGEFDVSAASGRGVPA
jgi:type I restriction enzyme S subunit